MAKCKDCNFLHKDGHCGAWLSQEQMLKIAVAYAKNTVEDVCPQFIKRRDIDGKHKESNQAL